MSFSEIIQKVSVPKKDIESISADAKYYVRYRVISSDRRKTSHWSQVFSLTSGSLTNAITQFPYEYKDSLGFTLTPVTPPPATYAAILVSWNILDSLGINNFDVYIKYNGTGNFQYYSSTSIPSILIAKPSGVTSMIVAILVKSTQRLPDYLPTVSGLPIFLGQTDSILI